MPLVHHLIIEKSRVAVGAKVTVNWQGEHVPAEILALRGKYSCSKMLHVFNQSTC